MKPFAALLALAFTATPAFAQELDPAPAVQEPTVRYQAVTEIDGEDLTVSGANKGPEGALVTTRRASQFRPLVKLRTHFDPELLDSANQIR